MFLVAIARPRTLPDGTYWDGKIGCWPFGEEVLALRTSPRRPAGTPEFSALSATKDAMRKLFVDELLPAILALAPPSMLDEPLFIQQDNAPAHIRNNNTGWQEALVALGGGAALNITIVQQPPQSPDLNILDLGFFSAMQRRQWAQPTPTTLLQLCDQVLGVFEGMPGPLLERLFITLFGVMNAIVDDDGGNNYRLPHFGKSRILNQGGALPETIEATPAVVDYHG